MDSSRRVLRKRLLSGAAAAEGVAVVIDVLRAFTSAAFMIHLGAEKIVLFAEPERVLRFKSETGALAAGEVGGRMVSGFDMGNSPAQIVAAGRSPFAGRTVAQRTSAGVTGAVAAARCAERVILGSYVTASAIAHYLQELQSPPETVSLVAMGNAGRESTPDDEGCASYLEHLLTGAPYSHADALQRIVEHECTQKFLRGDQAHFPPADPVFCLQRDLFGFCLTAQLEGDLLIGRRVDVPGRNKA
jgi:2-phosphosulfolactate phosphatase